MGVHIMYPHIYFLYLPTAYRVMHHLWVEHITPYVVVEVHMLSTAGSIQQCGCRSINHIFNHM